MLRTLIEFIEPLSSELHEVSAVDFVISCEK